MNRKLIILVGISGSGKSTFAKKYMKDHPGTVRVNRDDIRRQLLGELTQEYYSKKSSSARTKLEKHITVIQDEQIRYWLQHGYNVIADNTHLTKEYILGYRQNFEYLADIYIKPIYSSKEICKERVKLRDKDIDISYIDKQADKYDNIVGMFTGLPDGIFIPKKEIVKPVEDSSLPDCYIVDLDGTVADCTGIRSPYDGSKLYWDRLIMPVADVVCTLGENTEIIYLSGREDKWKKDSIRWICNNALPYNDQIYMRQTGDKRKDNIVKIELYEENIKGKYNVLGVFDDRKQVKHAWVNQGLFVFDVNQFDKIF